MVSSTVTCQTPSTCADSTARERVRISAPRSAASAAFSTTRRASSTKQSEYSKAGGEASGFSGLPTSSLRQIDRAGRRQQFAAADMVVEEQPQPQQPGRAQPGVVRQHETQGTDDVRGDLPEHLALDQRLAHRPKLVIFEIAQPAMHELGRGQDEVPAGQVVLSQRKTELPRPAASRAMPQPLMPPPMMARSKLGPTDASPAFASSHWRFRFRFGVNHNRKGESKRKWRNRRRSRTADGGAGSATGMDKTRLSSALCLRVEPSG